MSRVPGDWVMNVRLDPTAFIAPGAVVVGEVTMGPRSSVWFNSVVRGDSAPVSIGAGSNVQDGSVVHQDEGLPALIGDRVTIGHRAIIHGCVIEDDCLIGMGAVVLSGAHIERGSLVGAGALVREGQRIPGGSLVVGAPARVLGPVKDVHREAIRNGSEHYADLARSYMERGFGRPRVAPGDAAAMVAWAGPMRFEEWGRLLGALGESPDWVGAHLEHHDERAWRKRPGPDRWCALEVLCHLRDVDRDVNAPRLDRMLERSPVEVDDVPLAGWAERRRYAEQGLREAFDAWLSARRQILARLAPLGRDDWKRVAFHSTRGALPLADMVRGWVEHDRNHLRQIGHALGEGSR
jgi:carbonic anhydrase/acetyltransferase-like protein (isoleucine patch superfamily)